MNHGSLFSGIGGFDLAAERIGWTNVFHCEWMDFPRKVLHHYWPKATSYVDITKTDFTLHAGQIDVLTGGFPCQPYSAAGKRKGKDDDRHLWPHMLRAIREIRPRYVVGENVFGLTTWNGGVVLEEVCAELEAEGYAVQPFIIPAAAVGAPHRRDRVWIVAYYVSSRPCDTGIASDGTGKRLERSRIETKRSSCGNKQNSWHNFPTQSPICGGDDGIPAQLDGITFPKWRNESIKGYGNAIVPQVAMQIFAAIEQYDQLTTGFYPCISHHLFV